MLNLLKPRASLAHAASLVTRERPPVALSTDAIAEQPPHAALGNYASVAASIGFAHPHIAADLLIEEFKAFLRGKDWGVFSLAAVTAYMDKKAAEESEARAGWHWRPLREMDNITNARFGTSARAWGHGADERSAASDYYYGPHTERGQQWSNTRQQNVEGERNIPASGAPYDKLVPLHALRKVKAIEDEFAKEEHVSFFVCDYAPAPHIEHPDPFLMAVIDNGRLAQGVGRFVIDFWDEPGFGLEQQLTP